MAASIVLRLTGGSSNSNPSLSLGGIKTLEFRRTEYTEVVTQATNTALGVVKGTATREGGIYVESNGEMSLNGWDEMAAHSQVIYMTEEDFITYEDPPNSGLYPSFINRLVVIQPV